MSVEVGSKAKLGDKIQPLNEEILKGVWIDGIGLGLSSDYVILEGIITQPRSDKPYIVARLLFPPRLLEHLAKNLADAVRKQKEMKPSEVKVELKQRS
jgi:hypothetical protein